MPPLKNHRHEKIALGLFKGLSQQDAFIQAGYNEKWARSSASHTLSTNLNIKERVRELHTKAASAAVMTVQRRKERLSEIAEARISDFVSCDEHGTHIKIGIESAHSAAISEVKTRKEYSDQGATEAEMTRLKLHDPVRSIAELNKMEGEYSPANVLKVELEPGDELGKVLENLLRGLRGYTPPDEPIEPTE